MRRFNKFSFVFVSHIIQHIYVGGYCVSHKLGGPAKDEEVVVPAHSVTGEIETDSCPLQQLQGQMYSQGVGKPIFGLWDPLTLKLHGCQSEEDR